MNDAQRRRSDRAQPVTQLRCGARGAGIASQRIDIGAWRVTIWHHDTAQDPSRQSFWRSPGLYARRLARSR